MLHLKYEEDEGPAPEYKISKDLSDLTLMFIVSSILYFLAAGSLAIIMRLVQSGIMVSDIHFDQHNGNIERRKSVAQKNQRCTN